MRFRNLTLMVTENCNFFCKYCYHLRDEKEMTWSMAQRAIAFFLTQLSKQKKVNIFFYGGEPLLKIDLIKQAVSYAKKQALALNKKISFSITTNGSLLTPAILAFLNNHQFTLELSFDGTAQNRGRKPGTLRSTRQLIKQTLQYPSITLMVNSVFTSQTINHLSASVGMVLDLGVQLVNASLCYSRRWNRPTLYRAETEYQTLTDLAMAHYRKTRKVAVVNFCKEEQKEFWMCGAGRDSITITSGGQVWGCPLFYAYFKDKNDHDLYHDFFFGQLEEVADNGVSTLKQVSKNHARFHMDYFYTCSKPCFLCEEVKQCSMCPITIAFTGTPLGKIPAFACQLNRIQNLQHRRFHRLMGEKNKPGSG